MDKAELDPGSSPTAEFGAFLRSSRGVRGWRQEDLASAIDCSPTHASAVETGRCHPTERLARELDEAFGWDRAFARKALDLKTSALLEGLPEYVAHESRPVEPRLFDLGLLFPAEAWQSFVSALRAGEFDTG
ncbi:multiprotein-bridging factor 1 family protein [Kitasatospora sp. NPDC098663]|uniref:helix-turn-helix domain-containing protein n=1 Tax=Kitasatospora sp. NPDC098663 TaxID=3364096 RepID=UPI0038240AAB